MIRVLIPSDKEFLSYKDECKKLYTKVQDKICDPNSFEFISTKTLSKRIFKKKNVSTKP